MFRMFLQEMNLECPKGLDHIWTPIGNLYGILETYIWTLFKCYDSILLDFFVINCYNEVLSETQNLNLNQLDDNK